ncbi:DNA topoisomerase I [Candidatus Bathyarchaeota archaeon]|nr:DNA topoisomerase I [Candidatus Bathyarchaeota archaeon]
MKYKLKSLQHNGIYVPPYEYKGFTIKIRGHPIKLSPKTEQMALALVKKEQSITTPPDSVFYRNFLQDFLYQLKIENPSSPVLEQFYSEYMKKINSAVIEESTNQKPSERVEIDFAEVSNYIEQEKNKKLNMPKTEKKKAAEERKAKREVLKEKFGYAIVDGKRIEIANWTAEPSCLFMGRGNHPKRGKWKEGPREEDIILNLSPDSPRSDGNWKDIVWEDDKMYIAKWEDKLTGKIKYVWFSDSAFLKQKREYEKFKQAEKLDSAISKIEEHIMENLDAENDERKRTATVCWLILALNLRVGDEKDPGEADTVGAITLRPEHIKIESQNLHFDFLGKDSVRWVKTINALPNVIRNIEHYVATSKEYLFEGIDSKKVSRFLSEKMDGLTAKVFRTWRTTKVVKKYLNNCGVKKEDAEYVKIFHAKMANLEGAKVANHKKMIPASFNERLAKKKARFKELELQLEEKRREGKKTDAIISRIEKAKYDIELTERTKEYNLGTSLKSYIDPRVYAEWASKIDFNLAKLYPKTLQKKYSWALKKLLKNTNSEALA